MLSYYQCPQLAAWQTLYNAHAAKFASPTLLSNKILLNHLGNIYMKEDSLKILRGERRQEIQKTLSGIKASIAEQKRESHRTEEKVQI